MDNKIKISHLPYCNTDTKCFHFCSQYVGVLPFFIKVEGPAQCRQGEQVGLRVVVFNYQPQDIEAVVVLAASPDYKFVHVEENGIVSYFYFLTATYSVYCTCLL